MPDIYAPLLDDVGNVVVRPPKAEVDYFFDGSGIRRAWFDRPGNEPIYRRLSADEYVVTRKDDLERLVESVKKAGDFAVSDYAPNALFDRLRAALAPFVQEKTDG